VKGVVNLRGSVVAVVDLSARLGFGPTIPEARHIIIIVMIGDQTIGLLADVVSDILTIDDTIDAPGPGYRVRSGKGLHQQCRDLR
jgi:purine-binding chemotaxis protein CheW